MTAIDLSTEMERAAQLLEASDDYRVYRRFARRGGYAQESERPSDAAPLKTALYVDVETTGVDTEKDRIIELGIVPFEFDTVGRIYDVVEPMRWFNDPGVPIPAEIEKLTGITDDDVRGQSIDVGAVERAITQASLVIAHKADFDRRMLERPIPAFAGISWGCSLTEVPWADFGCVGAKLQHILQDTCREFYQPHRADEDCCVGVHVLASAHLGSRSAFSYLLEAARSPTIRVYATGAPFATKDELKRRGYHWAAERRVWYRDTQPADVEAEREWLRKECAVRDAQTTRLTARERYSVRSDR